MSSGVQLTSEPRFPPWRADWGLQEGEEGNGSAGDWPHALPIYSPSNTPCSSKDSLQDSSGSDKVLLKKGHYLLLPFEYLHLKDFFETPWKTADL